MTTWDILICGIGHRHAKLCGLLAELDHQVRRYRSVGVRVCYDNLQASYGDKCNALVKSSRADYVNFVDDDDMVAPDYVRQVMSVLQFGPDYVGYRVRYTVDGEPQIPVIHSLAHGPGWHDTPEALYRDISEKNPMKRELHLLGNWAGGWGAERDWADGVRASGRVVNEAWLPGEMYYYQYSPADSFLAHRQPLASLPPLPSYPWLTEVTA